MIYKLQHTLHVLVVLLAIHVVLINRVGYTEEPYANHGGARGRKGSRRWKRLDSSVMGGVCTSCAYAFCDGDFRRRGKGNGG